MEYHGPFGTSVFKLGLRVFKAKECQLHFTVKKFIDKTSEYSGALYQINVWLLHVSTPL